MKLERQILLAGIPVSLPDRQDLHAPWDGRLVARVGQAGPVEAWMAASAAERAFPVTRRLTPHQRAGILRAVAGVVRERREALAALLRDEGGKPLTLGRAEVDRAAETLDACAVEAFRAEVDVARPQGEGTRMRVTRAAPRGPVLAVTSFASPLLDVCAKLGPAVASGCPFVVRPSSRTPSPALALGEALVAAGWPEDAISVLPCDPGVCDRLVADARFSTVSFATRAGSSWQLHARRGRPGLTLDRPPEVTLLVEADADLDYTIPLLTRGTFAHAGQLRGAIQRVLVHASVYAEVCARFAEAAAAVPAGDPGRDDVECGPLIDPAAAERIEAWLARAESLGIERIVGGARAGNLVTPTVLAATAPLAELLGDDPSGPVAVIEPYAALGEVLERLNRQQPGSDVGLCTRSLSKVWHVFEQLHGGSLIHNGHPHVVTGSDVCPTAQRPASIAARSGMEALNAPRTLLVEPTPLDA